MAITKEKKKEIISSLGKVVKDSKTVVFVNFHKLLVKEAGELRRELKKQDVGYRVAKKSLLKRVLDASEVKGEKPELKGEVSVAYLLDGEDILAPARGIYEFQKKLQNHVSIIGGIFQGEYKSEADMLSIATIPPLQVLRGMFVNIINSPVQRFVIALGQIAQAQ